MCIRDRVKRVRLTDRMAVLMGAWCVLCCVFFLPRMHERYGIVGEVLLLCWAVAVGKPRGFAYVLLGLLPTMSAYAEYMFRNPFFPLQLGGAMNMALLGLLTWELLRETRGTEACLLYTAVRFSFTTCSHQKSVLKRYSKPDIALRYAPYGNKLKRLKKLM